MWPIGPQQTITLTMHREKRNPFSRSCAGFAELKGIKEQLKVIFVNLVKITEDRAEKLDE